MRIQALGDIDELNSLIGVLLVEEMPEAVRAALVAIQHDLFDLGGETCIPGHRMITADHVWRLDGQLEQFNADLAPLKEFILPGGSRGAAMVHLARTVCRRAERALVALSRAEASVELGSLGLKYLNRLSDLLFVLGRTLNRHAGHGDVLWKRDRDVEPGKTGKA